MFQQYREPRLCYTVVRKRILRRKSFVKTTINIKITYQRLFAVISEKICNFAYLKYPIFESMLDIINILPDSVANQIAAGEVIDRPASAVKELLENAVDAGAKHIQLIVRDAGRTLIQVIDDGCGMSENDARLCFERHATSKIKRANDLFCIHTMGFRGEALASIAAVAQVELRTRLHGAELGTLIELGDNGDVQSQQACTCDEGTNFMIKNLFCTIPARRNFLKKESIELAHIEEIFRRVALIYNNISFTFHSNDKILYNLKAGNMAQRIVSLFGDAYRQRLFSVDEVSDVVEIHGYICKPEYVRRTRGEQYLFVNERFIKHATLSAAVEKAYADLIPDHSFPSYFISMKVDPARLDVNIHPTKTEVRFVDEHAIFAILRAATKRALGQFALGDEIEFNRDPELEIPLPKKGVVPQEPTLHLNPNYNPFDTKNNSGTSTTSPAIDKDSIDRSFTHKTSTFTRPSAGAGMSPDRNKWENFFEATKDKSDGNNTPIGTTSNAGDTVETHTEKRNILPTHPDTESAKAELTDLSYISTEANKQKQLFDTAINRATELGSNSNDILFFGNRYIVSTLSSGLLVVDIQKAQERIVFDRLMRKFQGNKTGGAQQLLFPVTCTFSVADAEILKEMVPELQKMGFELNPIGITGFVVTATPADIDDSELQELLFQMITEYKSNTLPNSKDKDKNLCLALARQLSLRKSVTTMKTIEMHSLLAALFSCRIPNVSPSGKKTLVVLKAEDLAEKMR